jgi:phenylacetate-coenzyme A ligase PaaK-like adenylate-forming protein
MSQDLTTAVQAEMLAELPHSIERMEWSAEQIEARQRDGLRRLLAHAAERSPFHRRRLAGVDVDRFELADLATLPVMTKSEMMDDLADVYTDRRLSLALVEYALDATTTSPVPILDEYFALTSGGSSGRRGVFVLDHDAGLHFSASLLRPLAAQLIAMGGPPPGGLPIAMIGAPCAVHATGCAPDLTDHPDMPVHFLGVPATLPLPEIVERLNQLDAPVLSGYPTMLARLAAERRAGRLRVSPLAVTSTSETLDSSLRSTISEGFGVPIVNMFGSTEGLVGTSAPDDEVLVFNSDVCITELVDENNVPVPAGVASAKVLVTNLSNRVQPLIRYELNDRFVQVPGTTDNGHLHAMVQGRSDDVLRYDGIDIHPIVVRSVLVHTPDVIDYQVRQTRRGIDVAALGTPSLDVERVREHLIRALDAAGLTNAQVTLQPVATLQRHSETGKLQRFVPLAR